MNNAYINALADVLVAQGRRYGLNASTRAHLIEILSSVPQPCCKSEACESPVDPVQEAARRLEEDLAIEKAKQRALSAPGVPVAEPQILVPATAIPAALPTDEQVAEAVQSTADPVENVSETPLGLAPDEDEKV
jgi:hypothetical protein